MILQEPLFDLDDGEYAVVLPAIIVYIILTALGLIIVSIFIATLVEVRAIVKEYPFFIIVWQVTFANALNLLAQATCMIPCIFVDARDGELSLWYTYGAHIIDLTDFSVTFFFLLMAINRFAVFVMPCLSEAFTKNTTFYSVIVTWLFVLMIFVAKVNLATVEIKTTWRLFDFFVHSDVPTTIIILIGYIVPIIILLIYITIYAYLRKERSTLASRQKTHTDKNDVALLWQGFVIAIAFIRDGFCCKPHAQSNSVFDYKQNDTQQPSKIDEVSNTVVEAKFLVKQLRDSSDYIEEKFEKDGKRSGYIECHS